MKKFGRVLEIYFSRRDWTPTSAREWLTRRGFYASNEAMQIEDGWIVVAQDVKRIKKKPLELVMADVGVWVAQQEN